MIGQIVDQHNLCADSIGRFGFGQRFMGVIAAFNVNVRAQGAEEAIGGGIVEEDGGVHASEGGNEASAFGGGQEWAALTFQSPRRVVAVDSDEQRIAEGAGFLKIIEMADVQEIEHAVGENEAFVLRAQ